MSLLEFNARVELCRKFAKLEPHASYIWLAEAERWSRLAREPAAIHIHELIPTFMNANPQHRDQPSSVVVSQLLPMSASAAAEKPDGGCQLSFITR
jgi:hypothetical protein